MIGIIGGTGLGKVLESSESGERIVLDTPFGKPSGPYIKTIWAGAEVVFLSRHGEGHIHSPTSVPYQANIFGFKMLGVNTIIASGAVGSLREDFEPGHLVICDQVIDRTIARKKTFFEKNLVAHVEFADPFCPTLREGILSVTESVNTTVHPSGTYVCMEGPQFSTKAESRMHQQMGGDLIGMTCMPEAKLAREAEISYALVALPTDYDCWRPHEPGKDKKALLAEIIGNLNKATENANTLIRAAVEKLASNPIADCDAWHALEMGIWSDRKAVDPKIMQEMEPIIGKYFS